MICPVDARVLEASLARGWGDENEIHRGLWWQVCNRLAIPFVFVHRGRRYRRVWYDLLPTDELGTKNANLLSDDERDALSDFYWSYVETLDAPARRKMRQEGALLAHCLGNFLIVAGDERKVLPRLVEILRSAVRGGPGANGG